MKKTSLIFCIITLLFSTGCATITRGKTTAFTVTSVPTGAEIRFSSGFTCTTPCTLEMPRKPGFVVTATKDGFKSVNVNVVSSVASSGSAAMAGNILLGGIIGAGVDASTGAMNDLNPNPLEIILEAED